MKDLRRILQSAVSEPGLAWCLATLVKAEGSSYRQPGARLLVHPETLRTIGFLSGGCLEEEIAQRSVEVRAGHPELLFFDTRKLFGCEGRLTVYLERLPAAGREGNLLTELAARMQKRQPCRIVVPYAHREPSAMLPEWELVAAREGILNQWLLPPPRLLVIGEGPEVKPMAGFADGLGWDFQAFCHPDELPAEFQPDASTAAVIMTHKFGRDLASLNRILPWGLRYVGLLGPKKRHQELLGRFTDFRGGALPGEWVASLYAPAGLDTGSESPEEIAFSIIAEASAVLAGRTGGFLRAKTGTIHQLEAEA